MTLLSREKSTETRARPRTASKSSVDRLRINAPHGRAELEADRMANEVMAGGHSKRGWSLSNISVGAAAGPGLERRTKRTKALPQMATEIEGTRVAPPIVHEVLRSPGQPLDTAARALFEPRFGHDLSEVRLHTDQRAAESAAAVEALAYTVGNDVVLGTGQASDRRLLAHELAHTLQHAHGGVTALCRQPAPQPEFQVLKDFATKFPAAAALIKSNPAAMKLVKEASDGGATFGGFAEEGPGKDLGRAYTSGHSVYVQKSDANVPVLSMNHFLFELNNAIRAPKYAGLAAAATKGQKTDAAAAKKYAHDMVEGEVEGMLRLGEVWFETKAKYLGKKAHDFDKFDKQFYLAEYQSVKDNKKTKEEIITDVLARKYDTGNLKGKTTEQYYIEDYQGLAQ